MGESVFRSRTMIIRHENREDGQVHLVWEGLFGGEDVPYRLEEFIKGWTTKPQTSGKPQTSSKPQVVIHLQQFTEVNTLMLFTFAQLIWDMRTRVEKLTIEYNEGIRFHRKLKQNLEHIAGSLRDAGMTLEFEASGVSQN